MGTGRHRGPAGASLLSSAALLPRLGLMHRRWAQRSAAAALLIAGLTVAAIGGRPGPRRPGLDVTGTLLTTAAVLLIVALCARRVVIRRRARRAAAQENRGLSGEDLARVALEAAARNSGRLDAFEDFFASMSGELPAGGKRSPWPGFQVIRGGRDSGQRPAS
jgi:hypothetical protein